MFLFRARKNICTTPFFGAQQLHSWSTLKANVCIFLYISLKKIIFQRRFYLVVGGLGGGWKFLMQLTVWTLQNVLQYFILIEIFEN